MFCMCAKQFKIIKNLDIFSDSKRILDVVGSILLRRCQRFEHKSSIVRNIVVLLSVCTNKIVEIYKDRQETGTMSVQYASKMVKTKLVVCRLVQIWSIIEPDTVVGFVVLSAKDVDSKKDANFFLDTFLEACQCKNPHLSEIVCCLTCLIVFVLVYERGFLGEHVARHIY